MVVHHWLVLDNLYVYVWILFNMFIFGFSVCLNGRVLPHKVQIISSLVCVAIYQGDGLGMSADSDDVCAKRFERQFLPQVAVGLLSQQVVILQCLAIVNDARSPAP